MEQKLISELRMLYETSKEYPIVIRIRVRMRDLIDPDALCHAVDTTMKRYPYFCVELKKKDGEYIFDENLRPVIITDSLSGVELNSNESNFHMIAFSWEKNIINMDIFHGLTDGTGAYEILRTLLYYYCSERYRVALNGDGIRLIEDEISIEEWADPSCNNVNLPEPASGNMSKALNLVEHAGLQNDKKMTVYSVIISESEFMQFNIENDGSPGTMVALFLSRALAKLFPEAEDVIRIALCVNLRKALHAPLAHQSLVGAALLEYKKKMQDWPIEKQATAYRGMVFAQTQEEAVLAGVSSQLRINQLLLSMKTDQERKAISKEIFKNTINVLTAGVSYVGKANYKESEGYIRDFHLWMAPPGGSQILIEISAVNGKFTLDILQPFSSPIYVNALLKELEENNINYDLQDVYDLDLPRVKVPWEE